MLQFISRTSLSADVCCPTNCYWPRRGEVRFNFVLRTVHGCFINACSSCMGITGLHVKHTQYIAHLPIAHLEAGTEAGTNDKLTRLILHLGVQSLLPDGKVSYSGQSGCLLSEVILLPCLITAGSSPSVSSGTQKAPYLCVTG